jgi:sulfite exporter TauE/SafE
MRALTAAPAPSAIVATCSNCSGGGGGISDGDKGDIVISGTGSVYTIDTGVVTSSKILDGTIASPCASGGTLSILVFLVGAVMLFLGLKLIGIFPRIEGATISLPKSISRFLGIKQEVKEYSTRGVFITGALTFFLPCGFTQAMQIYAISTGSFLSGALIMGLFALGTAPGLLGIGGLSSIAKGSWGRVFFKFAGVLVIVFGLINVRSGWNLSGLVSSSQQPGEVATAPIEDGFQVIRMTQKVNGYSPRQFTIKKGVPVRWIVNSENAYTCAAFLTIPAYNLFTPLKDGENIIEFTPQESGPLRFSCSMGMYSGVFNVVE